VNESAGGGAPAAPPPRDAAEQLLLDVFPGTSAIARWECGDPLPSSYLMARAR
jgi:hypothetical protein